MIVIYFPSKIIISVIVYLEYFYYHPNFLCVVNPISDKVELASDPIRVHKVIQGGHQGTVPSVYRTAIQTIEDKLVLRQRQDRTKTFNKSRYLYNSEYLNITRFIEDYYKGRLDNGLKQRLIGEPQSNFNRFIESELRERRT